MTPPKAAPRTARERARAELTREIKEEARRQLAEAGADGLSLRAVASALGMVSSALYRYYPSRHELLTALIIDAYNALGDAAERAIASAGHGAGAEPPNRGGDAGAAGPARAAWVAACHAIRDWARANPHEYALIYGSPVPGYRAPEATIGPAARVPLAFVAVLAGAVASGEIDASGGGEGGGSAGSGAGTPLPGVLADQASRLAAALSASAPAGAADVPPASPGIPPQALVRAVIAWTQLFGMISFELFGQLVGSFEPADALFDHAVRQLASFVGLRTGAAPAVGTVAALPYP
jgi:AcrR family transcriptional regulator